MYPYVISLCHIYSHNVNLYDVKWKRERHHSAVTRVLWCLKSPKNRPDSKVHGANMGPTWGRQDPGGPHVAPMNLAIWELFCSWIDHANNIRNIKALHLARIPRTEGQLCGKRFHAMTSPWKVYGFDIKAIVIHTPLVSMQNHRKDWSY